MTSGTSNVSCSHLQHTYYMNNKIKIYMEKLAYFVKINGIKWPMCIASDEGPLPVYK